MARDLALLRRARDSGESVFSVYGWARPTLSLGRNQRARGCYDLDRMSAMGIDVVRRPTGGRALLHHREVTYSVTTPVEAGETLGQSYRRINKILVSGLLTVGVEASIEDPASPARRPTAAPCFAAPARGELTTGGRKLVGSAQWREEGALLQHGSILVEDDQSLIALFSPAGRDGAVEFASNGATDAASIPAPATLAALLGRVPAVEEIAAALFDAVRELEDADATPLDELEVRALARAEMPRFEDELWTWRR